LSQEDIDRMVTESEKFKKDDAEMLRKIEARNNLEGFIYRAIEIAEKRVTAKSKTLSMKLANGLKCFSS
jgi:molecular chaperone DnaK (HSP70)